MGVCALTAEEIRKHLPAKILSLGFPDHLHGNVDLTGSTLTSVDIIAHHGCEVVCDLSVLEGPQQSVLNALGTFDLVIDCGTIEHCANPANAFINAAASVKVGGRIIHQLPLNMINHGYWNICPVWFTDFYRHNEFVIEKMDLHLNGSYYDAKLIPWPGVDPNLNMYVLDKAALTMCVARRTTAKPISLPRCQDQWIK